MATHSDTINGLRCLTAGSDRSGTGALDTITKQAYIYVRFKTRKIEISQMQNAYIFETGTFYDSITLRLRNHDE